MAVLLTSCITHPGVKLLIFEETSKPMKKVLKKIVPAIDEKQQLKALVEELREKIEIKARGYDERLYVRLLGSSARDTWLRDDKDIDFFLFFPEEYSKAKMEEIVTHIGRHVLEHSEKHYAEHPYIRGACMGFDIEIVPCYAVSSPSSMLSAVDRTPFHHDFVIKRIEGKENDVRLFKQFLKGIGAYGAEARVEGFSGYLCELLIIKFGSFEALIEHVSKMKFGEVLGFGNIDKEKVKKFRGDALIFIDPVDANRNVASALSRQKLALFIHASREYLKKPDEKFFFPEKRKIEKESIVVKFGERGSEIIALSFHSPVVIDDILYPQVKKTLKNLSKQLKLHGFSLLGGSYNVGGKITILFELESLKLPEAKLHIGPGVASVHENKFLEKYRKGERALCMPFIKDDRWAVYVRRKFSSAEKCLEHAVKEGLPRHILTAISKNYDIYTGGEVFERIDIKFLADYFDPIFPWEY